LAWLAFVIENYRVMGCSATALGAVVNRFGLG